MRILITGGAGFIGSAVSRALAALGHDVTVFDNLSPQIHGPDPRSGSLYKSVAEVADVRIADVRDIESLATALAGQEAVLHLAADTGTGQSMYEAKRYVDVNVGGTAILLDLLSGGRAPDVRKVVVASSRAVYGEGQYYSSKVGTVSPPARKARDMAAGRFEPLVDGIDDLRVVATSENALVRPVSIYGITKYAQEALVMDGIGALGIRVVALRYQNVYGPGQSLRNPYTGILSIFSTQIRHGNPINIFEDGLESRDFVFIDDVVGATVEVMLSNAADGRVLNVGSGIPTTVIQVVSELQRALDGQVPVKVTGDFRLGDIRHNFADISQIRSLIGYAPSVGFSEGIDRFGSWVRDQELPSSDYEHSLEEMRRRGLLK